MARTSAQITHDCRDFPEILRALRKRDRAIELRAKNEQAPAQAENALSRKRHIQSIACIDDGRSRCSDPRPAASDREQFEAFTPVGLPCHSLFRRPRCCHRSRGPAASYTFVIDYVIAEIGRSYIVV